MGLISGFDNFTAKYTPLNNTTFSAISQTPAILFIGAGNNSKFNECLLFEKFGVCNNNSYQLQAQISQHYTEQNVTISDHWSIAPRKYSLGGLIGEVVYHPTTKWSTTLRNKTPNWLKGLEFISPTINNTANFVLKTADEVESSVTRYSQMAQNIITNWNGTSQPVSNQKFVVQQIESLITNRTLVTVWTPYATLENMAIIGMTASQKPTTRYASSVELSLEQWNYTGVTTRAATAGEKSALAKMQASTKQNKGKASTSKQKMKSDLYTIVKG